MRFHLATSSFLTFLLFMATNSLNAQAQAPADSIAPGTNKDFSFMLPTQAPTRILALWQDLATWPQWDLGLKSAALKSDAFVEGAKGTLVPDKGPSAKFRIQDFNPQVGYTLVTKLPLARLEVKRSLSPDKRTFTHRVSFHGFLGGFWAKQFGPRYRVLLPQAMAKRDSLANQTK